MPSQRVRWHQLFQGKSHAVIQIDHLLIFFCSHSVSSILGRRIVLFSYGSGCAASMFSMTFTSNPGSDLTRLVESCSSLQERLDKRQKVTPAEFAAAMSLRQETHHIGNRKLTKFTKIMAIRVILL